MADRPLVSVLFVLFCFSLRVFVRCLGWEKVFQIGGAASLACEINSSIYIPVDFFFFFSFLLRSEFPYQVSFSFFLFLDDRCLYVKMTFKVVKKIKFECNQSVDTWIERGEKKNYDFQRYAVKMLSFTSFFFFPVCCCCCYVSDQSRWRWVGKVRHCSSSKQNEELDSFFILSGNQGISVLCLFPFLFDCLRW